MAKKEKRTNWQTTLVIIFIVVAAVCGYFVAGAITKGDKFVLNGDKVVEVTVGGSDYVEKSCTVISFKKDLSNKLVIDASKVDFNTVGTYYIKYTVDNFRFKGVERYRIIKVVEATENE